MNNQKYNNLILDLEKIKNSNLSADTKLLVEFIWPTIFQLEELNRYIEEIVKLNEGEKSLSKIILEILIGNDEDKKIGKPTYGFRDTMAIIRESVELSEQSRQNRIISIEDKINQLHIILEAKYNEILNSINAKTPWYKSIQAIYQIAIAVSVLATLLLTIFGGK